MENQGAKDTGCERNSTAALAKHPSDFKTIVIIAIVTLAVLFTFSSCMGSSPQSSNESSSAESTSSKSSSSAASTSSGKTSSSSSSSSSKSYSSSSSPSGSSSKGSSSDSDDDVYYNKDIGGYVAKSEDGRSAGIGADGNSYYFDSDGSSVSTDGKGNWSADTDGDGKNDVRSSSGGDSWEKL